MNEQTNENTEYKNLWNKCLEIFKDNVTEVVYQTWFSPIIPLSWSNEEHTLRIQVPTTFFQEMLDAQYSQLLYATLTRVFGKGVKLKYVCIVSTANKTGEKESHAEDAVVVTQKVPDPFMKQKRSKVDSHLNANYTFDNFIEGTCNKVAKSAGEAIAHNPGTTFNPLFIYGGAGVGKTHLENAIGKKIEEEHPEKNIVYVDALMFQTQYQDAVKNNNQTDFLNFYQMLDVLIIDDIQEFMGKTGTQNTFFHIFNALHLAGKQLIFASDRAPKLLQGLDQRLLSRFKWGLSIEIEEPDFETRKAILRSKIEANELQIPDDVVEYVAETVRGNVRDLEGIVNALLAYATLGDASINLELAKNVVGQSINIEEKSINIKDIQKAVCDYYSLEVNDIQTNSRKHEVVQARQVAMFLARKHTKKSLQYIGAQIGNRDHATVLHACKTVENLLDIDKGMQKSINYIESHLI